MGSQLRRLDLTQQFKVCTFLKERAGGENKDELYENAPDLARAASKALGFEVSPPSITNAAKAVDVKLLGKRVYATKAANGASKRDLVVVATALRRLAETSLNFDGKQATLSMLSDVIERNKE